MSDINYRAFADESAVRISGETIDPNIAGVYDDILKLSNVNGAIIASCVINPRGGNREDGVDIMRYSRGILIRDSAVGCGKYAFTIKGGSNEVTLKNVQITGRPRWPERVDIDIGNYSATVPDAKTGVVVLVDVTSDTGRSVRVRVGWAERPIIVGGNVKVLFWQSLGLKLYVWFKRRFHR